MPAAVAIPLIAAGVGAGASAYAAKKQSDSVKKAADSQLSASNRASDLESKSMDDAVRAAQDERDYNRWLTQATSEARQPYLNQLSESLGFSGGGYNPTPYTAPTYTQSEAFQAPTAESVTGDPGFQFRLKTGEESIGRSAAARGTLLTGGTAKDLMSYGQDMGSQEYDKQYGRKLGEYQLSEQNRAGAFDRNAANQFNAAQLNNQGQYQAASLAQSAYGQRLSALASLAGMASPTGAYPGRVPSNGPGEGDQRIHAPNDTLNYYLPNSFSGPGEPTTNPGKPVSGTENQFDPQSDPWSWYGGQISPINSGDFRPDSVGDPPPSLTLASLARRNY